MGIQSVVVDRILQLCLDRSISVHALARLSAVPPSTLKNIINGHSQNTGIVTIKMLCDGLDISISDFFNTEDFIGLEQELV